MVRGYRQFYLEFEVSIDPFKYDRRKVLGCFAAIGANLLGKLTFIEFRSKSSAYEYRIVDENDTELKIGIETALSSDPKGWIHISVPVESNVDPRELAETIFATIAGHPELRMFIKTEEKEKNEG